MKETLFAHEQGEGEKTVVLLHGFGGTHHSWRLVQPRLAEETRTIAFDLPGHAGSLDYPGDGGPVRFAATAVVTELKRRKLGQTNLVGHSMGGAVAVLAALAEPAMFASLTLLAPGGFGSEINHRLLLRYAEARDREVLRGALENMFGWNNAIPDETLDNHFNIRSLPGQTDRLVKIAKGMIRDGKQGMIPKEQLATIEVPVKVLWGMQDRVLPTRQCHRLPPLFAIHVFEETGHMLPEEIPDEIVTLTRQNIR